MHSGVAGGFESQSYAKTLDLALDWVCGKRMQETAVQSSPPLPRSRRRAMGTSGLRISSVFRGRSGECHKINCAHTFFLPQNKWGRHNTKHAPWLGAARCCFVLSRGAKRTFSSSNSEYVSSLELQRESSNSYQVLHFRGFWCKPSKANFRVRTALHLLVTRIP